MCKYPEAQTKLREELLRIDSDSLSYDELNNLPYLDAVVRETLRLYCPVLGTTRVATEDCVIPLGTPIVDNKGVSHTEILYVPNVIF
jgi:cytochrome P450